MTSLTRLSAERFGSAAAALVPVGDEYRTVSYDQLAVEVFATAKGLIALGVSIGDRVAVLAETSYEFLVAELAVTAAGAAMVPVYPSSSAAECEWVIGNSGSTVLLAQNAPQVAKVDTVRSGLPELRHVAVLTGEADGALTIDELRGRGASVSDDELRSREDGVTVDQPCMIIYTSGTTGLPKGVVLANRAINQARVAAVEMGLINPGEVAYLFLPLAHVFGQLIAVSSIELGGTIGLWSGDPAQIVTDLGKVKPHLLPSVPRIFEKVYSMAMSLVPPERAEAVASALEVGVRVREAQQAGEPVSAEDQAVFDKADAEMFALVRGIFGGRVKIAISGAAPIAPEILRFFYACGVPVMEGWGMTETTALGTFNRLDSHRFGSIGQVVPGARMRVAADGELEITGDQMLSEYWRDPEATAASHTADGWFRTGDLGFVDDEGFYYITGRKKDIIITAGGKNLTPANLEGELRRSPWISQAVMFGDRKPYPVALITLDAEVVIPWAQANDLPTDLTKLAQRPELIRLVQADIDAANERHGHVAQIKRFKILSRDFTLEDGELTPSLKLKRNVVYDKFADEFESLYNRPSDI